MINKKDNKDKVFYSIYDFPIGKIFIASTQRGVLALFLNHEKKFFSWLNQHFDKNNLYHLQEYNDYLADQLKEYFAGYRQSFEVNLDLRGTEFQKKVWRELQKIPYGKTVTYKELALKVGGANYARAVGGANNKNPISIIIPCHRVIGSDGSLIGYAPGLTIKARLLQLEQYGQTLFNLNFQSQK
ncbi:hypothetical protein BBF96_04205 [Anoxybacter fermentans]|uniref:Methylated-DNA--protein-cysteine methyltransferase n=1 Tax=Anoxybacter fermentans TaxID=1323375 RepID=A0A3S9SWP5_9FIRM|nr:methylated-DNA--[protein]-cysteine S-methyltransferase [Anoxybacter fermentans]AZR72660.1 hypothetical protein BBF96_04205 [Anoxybacter fermentans]